MEDKKDIFDRIMAWRALSFARPFYQKYKELADKEDKVIFGGRLGMYKYFDMHNVIEEALKVVVKQ